MVVGLGVRVLAGTRVRVRVCVTVIVLVARQKSGVVIIPWLVK